MFARQAVAVAKRIRKKKKTRCLIKEVIGSFSSEVNRKDKLPVLTKYTFVCACPLANSSLTRSLVSNIF